MQPVSQGLQRRRFQTEDDFGAEERTISLFSFLLGGWAPTKSATGWHSSERGNSPLGRESGALAQLPPYPGTCLPNAGRRRGLWQEQADRSCQAGGRLLES